MPLCAYGGTPNQFPSPDEGPCECPVGMQLVITPWKSNSHFQDTVAISATSVSLNNLISQIGEFISVSCFQPKPDPKFSFKNRTIALIVQNSLTMNWVRRKILLKRFYCLVA